MKRIYILVNKYPNRIEPNACVFIQQLVWSFADYGYECKVIAPLPVNFNKDYIRFPLLEYEKTENDNTIEIYHPKYVSLGQSGKFIQKIRVQLTTWLYGRAVNRILRKDKDKGEQ